jgi:ELWxxDGT repeat protein
MNVRIFRAGLIFAVSLALAANVSDVQASGRLRPAAISVSVGTIDLVKDINSGNGSGGTCNSSAGISGVATASGLLFSGFDGTYGCELWITDGTSDGTRLVKDIYSGSQNGSGNSSYPSNMTVMADGRVIFRATNDAYGSELWITNGTELGTVLLKDIYSGSMYGNPNSSNPYGFTVLTDGRLLFTADDGVNGSELWITNGTESGTVLLKDIHTPYSSGPQGITALPDGRAIFQAQSADAGSEPWITDGTPGNTVLLKDIFVGSGSSFASDFTVLPNGKILFQAYDPTNGYELWITDGTPGNTVLLKNINAGISNGYGDSSNPRFFVVLPNGQAIFQANNATNGTELWITDGSSAETKLLKDINTGFSNGYGNPSDPRGLSLVGDKVYFWANDGSNGNEPWVTDGTSANTNLIANINTSGGSSPSSVYGQKYFWQFGEAVYFSANDGINGIEPWSSSIASGGANLVADIWPGSSGSMSSTCFFCSDNFSSFPTTNGKMLFLAQNGSSGFEFWALKLVPGVPRSVTVSATSNSASVSWLAPTSVGTGITSYTVTANPGAFTCSTATLSCTVTGLLSNQDYTFTVVATNATGDGPLATSSRVRTPSPQLGSLVDSLTPVSNIVSNSALHPGDALNVLYSGFNPNELVLLLIASNPVVIGSANADVNGNVVFLTTIPAGTATGSHHLIVYAPVSGFGASQAVTVSIPTPVAGTTGAAAVVNPNVNPDTLPATGRGVFPFLVALTLLIAGIALLSGRGVASRRG